ncbi:hypothetical protein JXA88_07175 [Candidatus Fermentibacteria bacterium]|nr:hypothetical protein [Candidatus Fermentibacteria bacterium]
MKGIVVALVLLAALPAHARISASVGFSWDNDLSFHGRWVSMPDVGEVWVPRVHVTWQPYLHGHWAWSPWGWMWVSNDPWGHLTDHYGRWLWTPHHGWVWVPGRVWSPAWVVWISGPGWIGWAPASPDWCYGYWRHRDYHRHHGRWVMVSNHGFLSPSLSQERLPETKVKADFAREYDRRDKRGYTLGQAPERQTIERVTGKIATVVVERPGAERVERTMQPHRDRGVVRERTTDERDSRLERSREPERTREPRSIERHRPAESPSPTREEYGRPPRQGDEVRSDAPSRPIGDRDRGQAGGVRDPGQTQTRSTQHSDGIQARGTARR